ncbi:MAG TPA: hypothetical protein ENG14_02385 [Thermodesulforhabdus norvegica]|uniref:Uncharacterized protein n=1 Tax=Thermodesulforhabdus norvegica TaxID=39841 RepID=A0A7C0WRP4_9BACT|nr:hypothetical protein [Thermodesulforhabdus norvegica]
MKTLSVRYNKALDRVLVTSVSQEGEVNRGHYNKDQLQELRDKIDACLVEIWYEEERVPEQKRAEAN